MKYYLAPSDPGITRQEKLHYETARKAAASGIVLMEYRNRESLPLRESAALFGYGASRTIFCGTGAASMNCRSFTSIADGLKKAGIRITSEKYLERYEQLIRKEEDDYYKHIIESSGPELIDRVINMYGNPYVPGAQLAVTEEELAEAKSCDTALFVISRVSGEGADRKNVPGDYQLSEEEKKNLAFLNDNFAHLIVLLNVGSVIDTKFIRTLSHLDALLMVGCAGGCTGDAIADVLTGKVTSEGKLTDTWAENYEDYPSAENYGAVNGNLDDEYYSEGIMVGYRHFDQEKIRPAYAFGHGLSYTEFAWKMNSLDCSPETIRLSGEVTNIGEKYSGREVLQLYVAQPQLPGTIQVAQKKLIGFSKTKLLAPGEKEEIAISTSTESLALYRELDSCWVIPAGEYTFLAGTASDCLKEVGRIFLEKEQIVRQCSRLFEEQSQNPYVYMPEDFLPAKLAGRLPEENLGQTGGNSSGNGRERFPFTRVTDGSRTLDEFISQLTTEEKICLCVGNTGEEDQTEEGGGIVCAGKTEKADDSDYKVKIVPGTCDTTRALIPGLGVPNITMADGGSGLRMVPEFELDAEGNLLTPGILSVQNVDRLLTEKEQEHSSAVQTYYQYATGLPMATLLAQTWDTGLAEQCGEIVGREMKQFGVDLFLAPSMNIHRNPLCGRNFEYYSEDPLITGCFGAAVTAGVQKTPGVGAMIKHLACNNQEDNRGAVNSHVSEQALREIYLKGYEIAVRRSHPAAMMTSLNLINGVHSANCHDLLTKAAREEWGFDGFVVTDWGTTSTSGNPYHKYQASSCTGCIHAGNDLIMPGALEDLEHLREDAGKGKLDENSLNRSVKRILTFIISAAVSNCGEN